jgi:glycosyltransferase involved in cell wall biosynthesis
MKDSQVGINSGNKQNLPLISLWQEYTSTTGFKLQPCMDYIPLRLFLATEEENYNIVKIQPGPWCSHPDIPQILAQNSIFALITNHTGLPLGPLEAMRAGLPVVASGVGGVPELVQDGQTGFLEPRGDLALTLERLTQLMQSPALREPPDQAGRARYQARFTLEAMLQQTLELYRLALKKQN